VVTHAEKIIHELLSIVDVEIDGRRPWDIQVADRRFFERALSEGSLGIGEAFMDGWWSCASIDGMISRVLAGHLQSRVRRSLPVLLAAARARVTNRQKRPERSVSGENTTTSATNCTPRRLTGE